jgi:hypothetical protein
MGLKGILDRGFSLFRAVFPKQAPLFPLGEEWKATRDQIRRIASPCPVCNQVDLSGHMYGDFASQIATPDSPKLREFFEFFKARRWRELNQIHEFDGRFNAAILYLFHCRNGACILAVRDPYELYDSKQVLDVAMLGEAEIENIRSMPIDLKEL